MTLKQAFTMWAMAPRNTVLAARSRDAVQKVLMKKWNDVELEQITETFARRIFSLSSESQELKTKAAAILVYLLQWGGDHGHCQRPTFTFEIAKASDAQPSDTEGTGICCDVPAPADVTEVPVPDVSPAPESGTAAEESETKTNEDMEPKKTRGRQPKPVAQIDPNTLQVIKEWPSMSEATKELNLCHVEVAISKLRKAGGFYWSLAEDADTFKDRLAEKQRQAEERQKQQAASMREKKTSKPKAEKNPKKLPNFTRILKPKEEIERLSRNLDDRPVDPVESAAVPQQPADHQRTAAAAALAVFTDDELLEELDRRGWQGELRRTQVVSIGKEM